jgi:K+-sensing histidine kinase KdpD
MNSCV